MGVFGAFFGCIGDGGFNGRCLGASIGDGGFVLAYISGCSGVIGFKVGTWLCPVREKVRPARPDLCVSAKKFAPHAQNGRKTLFSGALGEFFAEGPVEEPCWASFVAPTGIAPGLVGSAPSLPAMVGVLHYTKPSHSVSPACRTLMSCNSPRCSVPHAVLCAHRVSLVC